MTGLPLNVLGDELGGRLADGQVVEEAAVLLAEGLLHRLDLALSDGGAGEPLVQRLLAFALLDHRRAVLVLGHLGEPDEKLTVGDPGLVRRGLDLAVGVAGDDVVEDLPRVGLLHHGQLVDETLDLRFRDVVLLEDLDRPGADLGGVARVAGAVPHGQLERVDGVGPLGVLLGDGEELRRERVAGPGLLEPERLEGGVALGLGGLVGGLELVVVCLRGVVVGLLEGGEGVLVRGCRRRRVASPGGGGDRGQEGENHQRSSHGSFPHGWPGRLELE